MRRTLSALFCASFFLVACGGSGGGSNEPAPGGGGEQPPPQQGEEPRYSAQITRTNYGVPHITAKDWSGLGYGYGYVHAEDNLCVVLEDLVTVAGERARYFGRDGAYTILPNGTTANNVDSDFFWRMMASDERVAQWRAKALPEVREGTRGFAAGFSRYVRELKNGQHPGRHAACRDAEWLREISTDDLYRRYIRLALLASSSVFVTEIATAQPPKTTIWTELTKLAEQLLAVLDPSTSLGLPKISASNMYALGPEAVKEGAQPLLFGNPHFPWLGTERLYKAHLKIPGKYQVAGAGLYGVPLALIGYNEHLAWSHTVSTAYRFTLYQLKLVPGDPTAYFYDGEIRRMEAVPLEIEVLEDSGEISTEKRTLYRSHYGPMLELGAAGLKILPWNGLTAYTLRDANAENDRMINQYFKWNTAQSLDEFIDAQASILGVPWVNTVATAPNSPAYYADVTVVPNVPDSKVAACAAQPLASVISLVQPGLPLLDGSRSACEWNTDADAPAPGIFGPSNLPKLIRDDWVHNCNDSHWLTNPAEPLTGYASIIGDEGSRRSLRTRLCIKQVEERLAGTDGRPGDRFDLDSLQDVVLESRIHSAELGLDNVLTYLCPFGGVLTESGPVDISNACSVLANWDRKANLDSVGAHIWREFWREVGASLLPIWNTAFDPNDPVNTPRGLLVWNPEVAAAFGRAVRRVEAAGVPLDAAMGELQRSGIHDEFIPIFGGESFEGAFTIANAKEIPSGDPVPPVDSLPIDADGYRITYGNSYIQTVTWEPSGQGYRPIAEGFVTYSQSTDPASPYYQDFTKAYSAKKWHRFPYTEAEVSKSALESYTLTE